MDKKTLIICLSVLVTLLVLTVFGVAFLYSGDGSPKTETTVLVSSETARKQAVEAYPLLQAVPSDAAMIMTFGSLKRAGDILCDTTKIFGALGCGMDRYLRKVGKNSCDGGAAVLSMHYSGSIVPLLIVRADGKSRTASDSTGTISVIDTTSGMKSLISAASAMKMHAEIIDCGAMEKSSLKKGLLLLVSPSATLITASRRHLESGSSVLDKQLFPETAASASGKESIFVSHDYASKLFGSLVRRPYTSYSGFFGKAARWSVLSLKSISDRNVSLSGYCMTNPSDMSSFMSVYSSAAPGEIRFPEVAPASTIFAVSQSTSGIVSFMDARKAWLDSGARLGKYGQRLAELKKNLSEGGLKIGPEEWAERLDIKELAMVEFPSGESRARLVLVRPGKEDSGLVVKKNSPCGNRYAGFAAAIGGDVYPKDDTLAVYRNGWIISGSSDALAALEEGRSLASAGIMSSMKDVSAASFFSVGADPAQLYRMLSKSLSSAAGTTLEGVAGEYFIFTARANEISLTVDRVEVVDESAAAAVIRDTTLEIPSGPFKVRNSATGKTNLFSQAANGTLSLKEADGKGIWGVPFRGRICGRVENIDYYANGKLQFLFASGDKLYLIDRLGRFVKPFPVSVGKEILLGPDVYDFTGAHGYSVMVLHKDNTLGLYNLHGRAVEGWTGISPKAKVMALPELLTVKDRKYWAVRTVEKTDIYGFKGGQPLTGKLSGGRRISPTGEITVKDGSVSAVCIDGKTRSIKL